MTEVKIAYEGPAMVLHNSDFDYHPSGEECLSVKIIDGVCDDCEGDGVTCYETTLSKDFHGVVTRTCGECGQIY